MGTSFWHSNTIATSALFNGIHVLKSKDRNIEVHDEFGIDLIQICIIHSTGERNAAKGAEGALGVDWDMM